MIGLWHEQTPFCRTGIISASRIDKFLNTQFDLRRLCGTRCGEINDRKVGIYEFIERYRNRSLQGNDDGGGKEVGSKI